jgi:hypothetical protein
MNERSAQTGNCKQPGCKLAAWRRRLCYTHWRIDQGFFFDGKAFVKDDRGAIDRRAGGKRPSTAARRQNSARAAPGPQVSLVAAPEDPGAWLADKTPEPRDSKFPVGLHAFDTRG